MAVISAVVFGMGVELVNIARGFMIAVGSIGAQKCHTNHCPLGVATTDPQFQKALAVDEKKYRGTNYVLVLREGLFHLAVAAGLDSPTKFERKHIIYKDERGRVQSLADMDFVHNFVKNRFRGTIFLLSEKRVPVQTRELPPLHILLRSKFHANYL